MMRRVFLAIGVLLGLAAVPANAQLMTLGVGKGSFAAGAVIMVTPILSMAGSTTTAVSSSVVNYGSMVSGSGNNNWTGTVTGRQSVIATAGTIGNLYVNFPTAVVAGSYVVALFQNTGGTGNPTVTTLTCTISSSSPCQDTTHSVTVAPGDIIEWGVTPTGCACTAQTTVQISATFTSTVGQESPLFSGESTTNQSTSAVNYLGWGGTTSTGTTEALVSAVVPTEGTIDQLYVVTSAAAGTAPKAYIYSVLKNGTPTSLSCTITGAGSGAGITLCNDTNGAHAVSVVAGDTISFQSDPNGTTPTTSAPKAGVRWVPTASNEALLLQNAPAALSTTLARFLNLNGASGSSATETDNLNVAPVNMTVKKLRVLQSANAGGSGRTDTLRAASASVGTPGNVACTVAAGAATCNDATNSYAAAAGALLDIQTAPSGTNTALTYHKTSAVVTVP